jgi:hypothetical protein
MVPAITSFHNGFFFLFHSHSYRSDNQVRLDLTKEVSLREMITMRKHTNYHWGVETSFL